MYGWWLGSSSYFGCKGFDGLGFMQVCLQILAARAGFRLDLKLAWILYDFMKSGNILGQLKFFELGFLTLTLVVPMICTNNLPLRG